MKLTPTEFRNDIYNIIDTVIETGVSVDIVRNGQHVKLVAVDHQNKLKKLKPTKSLINGDPSELEDIDWSDERKE